MDDRILQFRVGVLLLVTALITFLLVVYFGQLPFFARGEYAVHVEFREAPGVEIDTPVRKNGILIGRVDRVQLEENQVLVTLGINSKYRLRTDEVCRIGTGNLFGDAVLEFVKIDEIIEEPTVLPAGAYVQGEVAQDPLKMLMELQGVVVSLEDDVEMALGSISKASEQVENLARNINSFVGTDGDQFQKLIDNSAHAMESLDRAATTFNQLLGDGQVQEDLRRALEDVPQLLAQVGDALEGFENLTHVATGSMQNIDKLTETLAERTPDLIDRVLDEMQLLDAVLSELKKAGQSVNQGQGTVGKLLTDRELYDRLIRTMTNIERVTAQLQPIVSDVRVFTNKVARNPSQLGLQGAINNRQSGAKWGATRRQLQELRTR